ncbi:hypothetical protein JCM19238_4099 [Vibrio ponticus]|nr:hypothetical protein JCM19238_4099 [Vibrio ponticus]
MNFQFRYWLSRHVVASQNGSLISTSLYTGKSVVSEQLVALVDVTERMSTSVLVISDNAHSGSLSVSVNDKSIQLSFKNGFIENRKTGLLELRNIPNLNVEQKEKNILVFKGLANGDVKLRDVALNDTFGIPVFATVVHLGDLQPEPDLVNVSFLGSKLAKNVNIGDPVKLVASGENLVNGDYINGVVSEIDNYLVTSSKLLQILGSQEYVDALLGARAQTGYLIITKLGDLKNNEQFSKGITTNAFIEVAETTPAELMSNFVVDAFKD